MTDDNEEMTVTEIPAVIFHIPKSRRHRQKLYTDHINVVKRPEVVRLIVPLNDPKGYIQVSLNRESMKKIHSIFSDVLNNK